MSQVRWEESALDELTAIWIRADSFLRAAITAASHRIERRLQRAALTEGESRSGGLRVVFDPPLMVEFHVDPQGQVVRIVLVKLIRQRP